MSQNFPFPGLLKVMTLAVLLLAASPALASPAPEKAEPGSAHRLLAEGLAAGTSLEAVLTRALEEGLDPCSLVQAAVRQDVELPRLFTFFLARLAADPEFADRCTLCLLVRCAVEQGTDVVEAANAMMSAGAKLAEVRACLGAMGFEGSVAYTYTPADPPALAPAVVPALPGNGGGSISGDQDPTPAS